MHKPPIDISMGSKHQKGNSMLRVKALTPLSAILNVTADWVGGIPTATVIVILKAAMVILEAVMVILKAAMETMTNVWRQFNLVNKFGVRYA